MLDVNICKTFQLYIFVSVSILLAVAAKPTTSQYKPLLMATCSDTLQSCQEDTNCRVAVNQIPEKCEVKNKSCNAAYKDLLVCVSIMDYLSLYYFLPENKCRCSNDDTQETCSLIYENIYENPCFKSSRYLRNSGLMPKINSSWPELVQATSDGENSSRIELLEIFASTNQLQINEEKVINKSLQNNLSKLQVVSETFKTTGKRQKAVDDEMYSAKINLKKVDTTEQTSKASSHYSTGRSELEKYCQSLVGVILAETILLASVVVLLVLVVSVYLYIRIKQVKELSHV